MSVLYSRRFIYRALLLCLVVLSLLTGLRLLRIRRRDHHAGPPLQAEPAHPVFEEVNPVVIKPVQVVLPALNEAKNLTHLLPRMPRQACGMDVGVLVVDDGSTDDTAEVAGRYGAGVFRLSSTCGGGEAVRLGLQAARRGGAQVVVVMDADGQHRPEDLERLVAAIIAERGDVAIGSRVLGWNLDRQPLRRLGLAFYNGLFASLTGYPVTDCSSGYRAFRAEVLEQLLPSESQYYVPEMLVRAIRSGLHIREVPVVMQPRFSGASRKGHNWIYGLHFGRVLLGTVWRFSRHRSTGL